MKASVIIPAYNAERTIGKCLEGLQKQSFRGFETIVVDDGSTDSTVSIVKRFKEVKLIQQNHAGPAVGRNNGASKASGEILVFTDSDCVPQGDWLEQMLKPFEDKDIAGVQGRYRSSQPGIMARFGQLEIEKRYARMERLGYIDFIGSYSAAYRKKVFDELQGFDVSFPMASGEDTDFSFRVNEAGYRMLFNSRAITMHHHPVGLKRYLKVKFYRAYWRTKIYKRHPGKVLRDTYTSQMIKVQAIFFFLFLAGLVWAVLEPVMSFLAASFFIILFLTTLPFSEWAMERDKAVGFLAPFIIILRTAAFGFGLAAGTLREMLGK